MDEKTAKEIQALRNQIGELQLALLAALAELKSLTALSTVLWEQQGVKMTGGRTILEVLQLLKRDFLNEKLAKLADSDMNLASKLRRRIDSLLKNQTPPNPTP